MLHTITASEYNHRVYIAYLNSEKNVKTNAPHKNPVSCYYVQFFKEASIAQNVENNITLVVYIASLLPEDHNKSVIDRSCQFFNSLWGYLRGAILDTLP